MRATCIRFTLELLKLTKGAGNELRKCGLGGNSDQLVPYAADFRRMADFPAADAKGKGNLQQSKAHCGCPGADRGRARKAALGRLRLERN